MSQWKQSEAATAWMCTREVTNLLFKSWQCLSGASETIPHLFSCFFHPSVIRQVLSQAQQAGNKGVIWWTVSDKTGPCFAVVDLVYWRNMMKTGVVFTGLVIGLASLFQLSAITVLSHICLGFMCITFPICLYYKLLELLRWNPGLHPFQWVGLFRHTVIGSF